MTSKVDDAMAAQRLEKKAIRELWVEEVRRADSDALDADIPLYLTLPGRQGGDLHALVDAGLVALTETGAIADTSPIRVVAVEGSTDAVLELSQTFPGLKILEHRLEDLLQATSSTLLECSSAFIRLVVDGVVGGWRGLSVAGRYGSVLSSSRRWAPAGGPFGGV